MSGMSWVADLPAFLPKFVPKQPAVLVAAVVLIISLIISYAVFKMNKDWFKPSPNLNELQNEARVFLLKAMYLIAALTVSFFLAESAFDLKYMLDNHVLNKEWSTYQTFFKGFR